MGALLAEFRALRADHLQALGRHDLDATALARRASHPDLGCVEVRHLLAGWAVHDLNHLAQIDRVLASRYRAAVGPWDHPDYLAILHWRRRG